MHSMSSFSLMRLLSCGDTAADGGDGVSKTGMIALVSGVPSTSRRCFFLQGLISEEAAVVVESKNIIHSNRFLVFFLVMLSH